VYYCNSTNEGKTFSPREMVSGIASRHCQISSIDHNNVAIVWNENFTKGDISSSRIGIELRDADGDNAVKKYITSDKGNATFPVIKSIDKNAALIAYTDTRNDKDYVQYQVVKF
jgi:hypothetical protein